jgi:hypothetical protein
LLSRAGTVFVDEISLGHSHFAFSKQHPSFGTRDAARRKSTYSARSVGIAFCLPKVGKSYPQ